jgi:osmotically-inducible protein OsmY
MRHFMMLGASLLAAAALLAAPTGARAAGDKVEDTGQKAKGAVESTGNAMSDAWVTAKTKIALFADERVKGHQVNIDTANGTVTLRGKVDSENAKAAAGEIAKGIDGVKRVKNELVVVAPAVQEAVEESDDAITERVKDRLANDSRLKKSDIEVRTDAGVVTLTGEAPSIVISARASEVARGAPGVRAVRNDVEVKAETADTWDRYADRSMDTAIEGSQLKAAQEALKELGHYTGPIDGVMGPRTASALRKFQKDQGLPVTGRPDSETLAKLGAERRS